MAAERFTFIDLFAGIGGIRLGFEAVGGKCVFSSEFDEDACKTYEANFGEHPSGDITKISTYSIPDFDVLLVGAGAYGSFLALYAKSLGKQGIQTGGATSTLFGIMGRRWENRSHVSQYVNENWIHPTKKVEGFKKVENGAYW